MAKVFGGHGTRPDSLASFEAAVVEALEAQTPTLIEVREGADWLIE